MRNKINGLFVSFLVLFILVVAFPAIVLADQQADPTGADTDYSSYVASSTGGAPSLADVTSAVGHNSVAINIMWTLLAGFLVMFMQAGFAMVETGFVRVKNVAHTMAMNFFVYPLGMLGFFLTGFAIMFGGVGPLATLGGYTGLNHEFYITLLGHQFGLFGMTGFGLIGTYDVGVFALFLFQMVFMDTTATIPTGALAERWKFLAFCFMGFAIGAFIYPLFGNWVWGGGWLSQLGVNFGLGNGHVDFAGSSVVHMTGGVIGLVGAWLIGPRIGKYNKDGSVNAIPGHSIPMAIIGTFILAFGWFGFNAGSTMAGEDLRLAVVATNTMLASATGAVAATAWMWAVRTKKPDPGMACNGMLAGLVAITAPCAFVNQISAAVIGLVSGILVVESVFFVERKLKIDDPVGAVSVHMVNGAWGCLALGLFADGSYGAGLNGVPTAVTGLLYGQPLQFVAELIGVATNFIVVGGLAFVIYKLINLITPMRVSTEVEIGGLDVPEVGCPGYVGDIPETGMNKSPEPSQIRGQIALATETKKGKAI
ncbi:MAG: ammonium transporter [Methanosarcina vacuolata]|jgi:Amt family ammonium transporter|uniref:ammonium transporter n=1 Tax=Methanosarcina sp. Kolksee TaxID=1434099 RepID=UPI000616131F|nr:ammonium transporter [Methanosarcina sp. Kolksee]AKB48762.1 Ammonium transporter [Methanosarcina sp. Kolksee]MDY0129946.1 ammonium transporter [Methanosarcina vacuolata]